jgi:hypothetical protein
MQSSLRRTTILAAFLLAVSAPIAFAQTPAAADDSTPAVGVQYALMGLKEVGGSSKVGFDADYTTRNLSGPFTGIGIRAAAVAQVGIHKFDDGGGTLLLVQGGVQLKSDTVRGERIVPTARITAGFGHFPEGTDFVFTLMPGLEFTLENKPYLFRVEAGQVWDVFDGGKLATWRYGFGVVLPLK